MFLPRDHHALVSRDLYSPPPAAQTAVQDNPTLLVSWWCTGFSLAIICFRLSGRWIRTEKMFREDKVMALAIIPLLARMACIHVVLRFGTNNAVTTGLSALEIHQRVIGSQILLPGRIFFAAYLWVAKLTITEFLKRVYTGKWRRSWDWTLLAIKILLGTTFVGVVVSTFAECQPFDHYWQVVPDPGGACRQGYAQLLTLGGADIITDLALIAFPMPIVVASNMRLQRKISLVLLFSLSLILVAVTIYRVEGTIARQSNQQFRSLMASLQILAATGVANALVLGSFVRDRGVKKNKFKFGSVGNDSGLDRPTSRSRSRGRQIQSWGSDIDLVGDLGMRLTPDLRSDKFNVARPAPAALPLVDISGDEDSDDAVSPTTKSPRLYRAARPVSPYSDRPISPYTDMPDLLGAPKKNGSRGNSPRGHTRAPSNTLSPYPVQPTSVLSPTRMSFFDVGGLLGDDPPPLRPSTADAETVNTPRSDTISVAPLIETTASSSAREAWPLGEEFEMRDFGRHRKTPEEEGKPF